MVLSVRIKTMNTKYKNHSIEPKRDFDPGMVKQTGFVVVKNGCNVMPGGCWFNTVKEAKHGINVLLKVKGDADKFWEIMQPFKYRRLGQRSGSENAVVTQGRFSAVIENFKVVVLMVTNRNGSVTTRQVKGRE